MARVPNAKKIQAIELLAAGGRSYTEVCEEVDITMVTLRRWRDDKEFADAVLGRARELLKEKLPSIYGVLSEHALDGSARHTKILLDHIEKLEDMASHAHAGTVTFTWRGASVTSEGGA